VLKFIALNWNISFLFYYCFVLRKLPSYKIMRIHILSQLATLQIYMYTPKMRISQQYIFTNIVVQFKASVIYMTISSSVQKLYREIMFLFKWSVQDIQVPFLRDDVCFPTLGLDRHHLEHKQKDRLSISQYKVHVYYTTWVYFTILETISDLESVKNRFWLQWFCFKSNMFTV